MKTNIAGEQQILAAVAAGKFRIDNEGRVWKGHLFNRRAEHKTPQGYMQIRVMVNGVRACSGAHRIVYQSLVGPIPPGLTINHINGVKEDNRPENLEVATYSQQCKHAFRTGLKSQDGEKNPASKLTNVQVESIREEYAISTSITQKMLADKYGVSFQAISKIVRGERRKKQGGTTSNYALRRKRPVSRNQSGRFTS
jgi:ribosomal protein S25